jgi:hypothetical protein
MPRLAQEQAIYEIVPAQALLIVYGNQCLFLCGEQRLADALKESV